MANSEKRLSICLRSNGFSFSVATVDDLLLTVGDCPFEEGLSAIEAARHVAKTIGEDEVALGFKQMSLILPTMQSVCVPAHLYDPSADRQYLATVARVAEGCGIYHSFSAGLNAYFVFAAPSDVATSFKVTLPGIDVLCQHAVLAEAALRSASSFHPYILLHVREGAADIEAFFNGNLLLSNSYPAGNSEEVLYHALSVMKHLHLETPDMELAICGLVDRTFFSRMQHFFPNVTLYTGKTYTFLNPEFQTLHTYRHTLILS
ncbi:MAG: DUF3822 family protein [Bacteroidales bacterium]|nr:DUF3822 family protein [Bacteroidales bacterium]